jgi:hypothetical protein
MAWPMAAQPTRVMPGSMISPVRRPLSRVRLTAASNGVSLGGHIQAVTQHHGCGENHADRVGQILPRNVRRRA